MVVREIEAWYLAGLNEESSRKLGVERRFDPTNNMTKDKFNRPMPKKFGGAFLDFKIDVLKHFDIATAKRKNGAFAYFAERFLA